MTDESNVTGDAITIRIGEETATVQPELLREWVEEANGYLGEQDAQKENLKGLVETIVESTKLPKKLVNKFLKARYKEATKAESQAGEVIAALDEAMEG